MKNKSYRQKIVDLTVNKVCELNNILYPGIYNIKYIKSAYFTDNGFDDILSDIERWNTYVDKVRDSVGAKHYVEWVRDCNNNMYGVILFLDKNMNEIKMKHFLDVDNWKNLYKLIKNEIQNK